MANIDFKDIEKIVPVAAQTGNLSGINIIAEIFPRTGGKFVSFLLPPDYLPFEEVQNYIVQSAIVKYGYSLLKDKISIHSKEELENFIQSLEESE